MPELSRAFALARHWISPHANPSARSRKPSDVPWCGDRAGDSDQQSRMLL